MIRVLGLCHLKKESGQYRNAVAPGSAFRISTAQHIRAASTRRYRVTVLTRFERNFAFNVYDNSEKR